VVALDLSSFPFYEVFGYLLEFLFECEFHEHSLKPMLIVVKRNQEKVKFSCIFVFKESIVLSMPKVGRPRKPQTKVVYARISKELERRLRGESKRERRELSATIGLILEKYFDSQESAA
jgi:hypothetical protein